MIGPNYWSIGIAVRYQDGAWGGTVSYLDDGWMNDDPAKAQISTEGTLRTRYFVDEAPEVDTLTAVIDTLKANAEQLGITWQPNAGVYYDGDGEWPECPPPEGWRDLINGQAVRLGWKAKYTAASPDSTSEEG